MSTLSALQLREALFDIIKTYRVPDLQALLEFARLSRQGNKRDLLQRCRILLASNLSPQLVNKIYQINLARANLTRNNHLHGHLSLSSVSYDPHNQASVIVTPNPYAESLPQPKQIQCVQLPFFEKIRTIESINIPINWNSFAPINFLLPDFEVDFVLKGIARVILRLAPTITSEKQNDVLPPYLFVQCNNQTVINNNVAKTVGSQAHSITFPTDITDTIIRKENIHNTLTYHWIQSPLNMSLKNLPRAYTLKIQIVRCLSLDYLMSNILKREPVLKTPADHDSDIEIEDLGLMTTRHRVSLLCPITQSLMIIPAKSLQCSHLTCFDLRPFLEMNQRRLNWTCPLCKKSASYENLCVDKRLQTILSNAPAHCTTVEIDSSSKVLSDCHYIIDNARQEKSNHTSTNASSDSEDDQDNSNHQQSTTDSPTKSRRRSTSSDCIVLSSENESRDETEPDDNSTHISNSSLLMNPLSNTSSNQNPVTTEKPTVKDTSQSLFAEQSVASMVPSYLDCNHNNHNYNDDDADDEDYGYWRDIAKFTSGYMTSSTATKQNSNRKRSSDSVSPRLSAEDDYRQRKRSKRSPSNKSQSTDIEVIVLSSSDSSDNDDH